MLDHVITELDGPLIVVNDGLHYWHHRRIGFLGYMWPRVKPGGAFVIAEIHTSFPAMDYQGSSRKNVFDYLKCINRWVVGNKCVRNPHGGSEEADDGLIENYWPTADSMHFYRATCILHRRAP